MNFICDDKPNDIFNFNSNIIKELFISKNIAKRSKSIPRLLDGKYFSIIKEKDGTKIDVVCNLCGSIRKGDLKSTGNFMDHINKSHPTFIKPVDDYKKGVSDEVPKEVTRQQRTVKEMLKTFSQEQVSFRCEHEVAVSNCLFRLLTITFFIRKAKSRNRETCRRVQLIVQLHAERFVP